MGSMYWRPGQLRQLSRRELLAIGGKGTVALLVIGPASGLLAACGGDDDDDDDDGATDPTATAEPAGDGTATSAPEEEATESSDVPEGEARAGGTLNYATLGDIGFGSLDMTTTTGTYDLEIGRSLNDPYIWLLEDGSFAPGLAESWEVSDDALQYTFKLREDVVFHDGTPLDAEAVVFNFDRMTNRETNPSGLSYSYLGAGGAGFVSTEVVDDYTFRINLDTPNAIFLLRMRRKYVSPQSPAAIEQFGEEYFRNPVGCGPFKFVEWSEGDRITMERFEDYTWGPPQIFDNTGPAYLEQVVYRVFDDLSTKATALEAGEVHYAARLNPEDVSRFQDMSEIEVVVREQSGQATDLNLNVQKFPTDDLAVRQAIGWAIDREAMVESLFFGLLEPAYHILTPSMWSYDASLESLFGYDPDQAESILEEAGWTRDGDGVRTKDGEELNLLWLLSQETLPVGQFVQANLRDIGMNVELQVLAGAGLTEALLAGNHNIEGGEGGWIQEDPDVFRAYAHSSLIDVRQNFIRAENAELDDLLDQGIAFAGDPRGPEREQIYKDIQRIMMEEGYVIPVYYRRSFEAYQADLAAGFQNIGYDPYGTYHEWVDVWLES